MVKDLKMDEFLVKNCLKRNNGKICHRIEEFK